MTNPVLPIFIGYDHDESVAYHVLAHSILRRSSVPVALIPLRRELLAHHYHRPRGELDSTDFSNSRFIVPALCDYEGIALFMDCDMLCRGDIFQLILECLDSGHPLDTAIHLRKHNHVPTEDKKFLDRPQTRYERKNWSSLMLFNNALNQALTDHYVNTISPALRLHQFEWLEDEQLNGLSSTWNHLVDVEPWDPTANLIHYTKGGPWHEPKPELCGCIEVAEWERVWWEEYEDMLQGSNPVNYRD